MSDEIAQPSPAPAEPEVKEAPQPTLADVAKKYNVEEEVKNFNPQPQQPAQVQPQVVERPFVNTVPDPITDLDGWNKYQAYQRTVIDGTLRELTQTVSEIRKEKEQEKLNVEVNKAVTRVNEKLKIDPVYAEIMLEKKYRDDKIFKRIWDNRQTNPKALEEALDVIASEGSKVFQVRSDPQLVENQRAAKASQKAMSTTQQKSGPETGSMSDAEFDRWWNSTLNQRAG